jgi:hypothetical protein
MFEEYSRQALPSRRYRELLGSAICVFNANNQFIIENVLRLDASNFSWVNLIDKTSGLLTESIRKTVTGNSDSQIADLFASLTSRRNRIIHIFQITENNEQLLRTKEKGHDQFTITERYLLEFIRDNEVLSGMLHNLRGF